MDERSNSDLLLKIKSRAKVIAQGDGLKHMAALEHASRELGFQSYHEARKRALSLTPEIAHPLAIQNICYAYVSTKYFDEEQQQDRQITFRVTLRKDVSWLSVQARSYTNLGTLKSPCSFRLGDKPDSERTARRHCVQAARSLLFMDATGLVPDITWKGSCESRRALEGFPYEDHGSTWYRKDQQFRVSMEQPYNGRLDATNAYKANYRGLWESVLFPDVKKWAGSSQSLFYAPNWYGTYPMANMFLFSSDPREQIFREICDATDQLIHWEEAHPIKILYSGSKKWYRPEEDPDYAESLMAV